MNTVLRRFIALVVFVMVGCMLPLTIAAQTGFDDLPDPTADAKQPTGVGDALPVTIDNTPDSIAKALMSRPAPGSTREGDNPVLFLIGNSTMRNGTRGDGSNGQWGWGFYASQFFNGRIPSSPLESWTFLVRSCAQYRRDTGRSVWITTYFQ